MEIPKEGFCKTRKREIIQFFKNLYPDCKERLQVEHIGIAWNKGSFWFIKEHSFKPLISEELLLNIIQLKVGKWYKINNNDIAKFHHLKEDKFYAVNWISDGKFASFEKPVWDFFDYLIPISIEEVRQYLPDGHPDKLSKLLTIYNLVEGEVYYCLNNTICKWGKNDSTHSINIEDKDIWDNEPGCYSNEYGFRLATPEEKHWLNMCISEGKFVEKEVALKDYNMYGVPLPSEVNGKKMKQCVRCDNELQFDFAAKKLKCTQKKWFLSENHNCISLEEENRSQNEDYYIREGFEVLSFQEWLNLDDYTFEKEIKEEFKVGDWVYADRQSDGDFRYELGDSYIPVFKVEEIYKFSAVSIWLRPIKNKANGIESKYCRLATPEEIAKVTKLIDKPFEFNKWYKYKGQPNYLVFIHKNGRYGFNTDGDWFDQKESDSIEHFNKHKDSFVLAEDSEVKERLLSYAKEKYPIGTRFNSTGGYVNCIITKKSSYILKSHGDIEIRNNDNLIGRVFSKNLSKWAEIISTPETKEPKEMQLSDLKNPVFNIGDKVRVIADSLTEFNSSWINGNNANYKKRREGLITKIGKTKSYFEEVNTWYYLDNNSKGISCNLLELVEPVKKEFDRNWYVEVNSQEEADKVFDWLEAQGENTFRGHAYFSETSKYIRPWNNTKSKYHNKWFLSSEKHNKPQKQLSDILPEYKQPIRTKAYYIIDANEDLRNEIQGLINQRDFKSSDFAQPIIIKSKKQKRNKLIIVNN